LKKKLQKKYLVLVCSLESIFLKTFELVKIHKKMRKKMNNKKIILLFSTLMLFSCSGTIPNVGNEVAVQETPDKGEEVIKQEVSVETFTIQEPESPPLPVTVFEPYMIKRGDYLIKIAAREYGDTSMWREIYEWNKQEIGSDPDKIYPYNFLSLKRNAEQAKKL
jgi:LysM repeat protein